MTGPRISLNRTQTIGPCFGFNVTLNPDCRADGLGLHVLTTTGVLKVRARVRRQLWPGDDHQRQIGGPTGCGARLQAPGLLLAGRPAEPQLRRDHREGRGAPLPQAHCSMSLTPPTPWRRGAGFASDKDHRRSEILRYAQSLAQGIRGCGVPLVEPRRSTRADIPGTGANRETAAGGDDADAGMDRVAVGDGELDARCQPAASAFRESYPPGARESVKNEACRLWFPKSGVDSRQISASIAASSPASSQRFTFTPTKPARRQEVQRQVNRSTAKELTELLATVGRYHQGNPMFDAVFAQAKQTLLKLMSPAELHATAIKFLDEGAETEEAAALRGCSIEYGEVRCQRGKVYEIDITLRCGRDLFTKLSPRIDNPLCDEEPELKVRIAEALKASLPSGYGVANVDPRARSVVPKDAERDSSDGSPADPINYGAFTAPESLSRIGRAGVADLLAPFTAKLQEAGLSLPSPEVNDSAYFPEVSRILRAEDRLPSEVREVILAILEASRSLVAEVHAEEEKEFRERHAVVSLMKRDSGRGLLALLAGCYGTHQDYPEQLSPEQAEHVGFLLDFLRDYADIHDVLEPSDNLRFERTVTERLLELERSGLAVFAGKYGRVMAYGDGTSGRWPVAVVLIASIDDPRIRRSERGEPLLQIAIPKPKKVPNAGAKPEDPRPASGQDPMGAKLSNSPHGEQKTEAAGEFVTIGRLRYSQTFEDVWVDGSHFDLRGRRQAQLCLKYLVGRQAFSPDSACHLGDEIDKYVRETGGFRHRDDVRIDHYFNASKGSLPRLRKTLIAPAGRNGRFFLKVK